MGTRHFIGVVIDDEFKIAQYGQWDGYPSGQGATVHAFLTHPDLDIVRFIENVRRLRWVADAEIERINNTQNWSQVYPWLSRDAGAEILKMVYDGYVEFVGDHRTFPLDGLFCEYAYVIDLDGENPTLEVYDGFHKKGEEIKGRWADQAGSEGEYAPVSLIKTYEISELPDLETFCAELEGVEEEEEAHEGFPGGEKGMIQSITDAFGAEGVIVVSHAEEI